MSRVSKDSVGDKGKKGCSSEESLGKGKKCNNAGAFWVYSGRRMENNCEGPFMAAGLGLECKI